MVHPPLHLGRGTTTAMGGGLPVEVAAVIGVATVEAKIGAAARRKGSGATRRPKTQSGSWPSPLLPGPRWTRTRRRPANKKKRLLLRKQHQQINKLMIQRLYRRHHQPDKKPRSIEAMPKDWIDEQKSAAPKIIADSSAHKVIVDSEKAAKKANNKAAQKGQEGIRQKYSG